MAGPAPNGAAMTAVVTPLDLGDHHAEDGRFPYLYSILVHTTTHADVHVSLRLANGASAIARPHYSRYAALCDALIARLQTAQCRVVYLPDMKANDVCDSSALSPIGVEFDTPVPVGTVGDWRMRTRDECQEVRRGAVCLLHDNYVGGRSRKTLSRMYRRCTSHCSRLVGP